MGKKVVNSIFTLALSLSIFLNVTPIQANQIIDVDNVSESVEDHTDQNNVDNNEIKEVVVDRKDETSTFTDESNDVDKLFENNIIKEEVTASEIQVAQDFVDSETDAGVKAELQAKVDEALRQLDARVAVQALYNVDGSLVEGTTENEILAAEGLVDLVQYVEAKDAYTRNISDLKAQVKIEAVVTALFDATNTEVLASGVTEADINSALDLAKRILYETIRSSYESKINEAKYQFLGNDIVNNLLDSSGMIVSTVDQDQIDTAREHVLQISNTDVKEQLLKTVEEANNQFNGMKLIDALFDENASTIISFSITETMISEVQGFVDGINYLGLKLGLTLRLNEAKKQFEVHNLISALYADEEGTIIGDIEHTQIEAISDKIEALFSADAQELFMEKLSGPYYQLSAIEAVEGLFDPVFRIVKPTVTHLEIEKAFDLIDEITNEGLKTALMSQLTEAYNQLTAMETIEALFDPTTRIIKKEVSHLEIEAAFDIIDEIMNVNLKKGLMSQLTEAYNQLTAMEALETIFDASTGMIKPGVTHLDIEQTFDIIDAIMNEDLQTELMSQLTEVFNQLSAMEAVEALFDPATRVIKEEVSHLDIETAFDLVDEVTNEALKKALMSQLTEAFNQLSAMEAIDALFDPETGIITDDARHLDIETAFDFVDEIMNENLQSELMSQLTEAFNQLTAKEALESLFVAPELELIDREINQENINDVQKLIDEVLVEAAKEIYQEKLDEAQKQYDNNLAASDAVNALFDENGNIVETLDLAQIESAELLVDKVIDPVLKGELEDRINDAKDQLKNRKYEILEDFVVYTGKETMTLKIDAPFHLFDFIYVNGAVLDPSHYVVSSGSTVITLNKEYLDTLENNTYDLAVRFTNGTITDTKLTVNVEDSKVEPKEETKDTVDTGIQNNVMLYSGIAFIGLLTLVQLRKKYSNQ